MLDTGLKFYAVPITNHIRGLEAEFSLTPNLEFFTPFFCFWLQLFEKSQLKSKVKLQLFLEDSIFSSPEPLGSLVSL